MQNCTLLRAEEEERGGWRGEGGQRGSRCSASSGGRDASPTDPGTNEQSWVGYLFSPSAGEAGEGCWFVFFCCEELLSERSWVRLGRGETKKVGSHLMTKKGAIGARGETVQECVTASV